METTATTESDKPRPAGVASIAEALGVGLGLLAGLFIVVRTSSQFTPYTGEAAFCGIVAVLFGLFAAAAVFAGPKRIPLPRGLSLVIAAWIAIFAIGLWRSNNLGTAIPVAGNAGLYALMLLCGYITARLQPLLIGSIVRAIIGMAAVEALAGAWQYFVELPEMQQAVASGKAELTSDLQSGLGMARLMGRLIFTTFNNPNSLAGYLLVGLFLLLGLLVYIRKGDKPGAASAPAVRGPVPRIFGAVLIVMLLIALAMTGSKGGMIAAAAGLVFFAAQWVSHRYPHYGRAVTVVTAAGVAAAVLILALGCLGVLGPRPFGLSMEVRLDYWRSALAMWKEHPFGGVGLSGFADNYSFFKMPMGEEVKDTHNDYLQLATELGLLAPLIYAAIWWLALRRPAASEARPQSGLADATGAGNAAIVQRQKALDWCVAIGGVFGFLLMDYGFKWFESGEIVNLLHGMADRSSAIGLFHTLALPALFAAAVVALRPLFDFNSPTWIFGCRAAIGAVLIHQLVDFDFHCPATMTLIFFCGGMLAGIEAERTAGGAPAGWFALRRPGFVVLTLVLLLAPAIAWIPLKTGNPRSVADDIQKEIPALAAKAAASGGESPEAQRIPLMLLDVLDARKQARDAAPFDAQAWLDVGNAYEVLPPSHATAQHHKEALACYEKAAQLRPQSFVPKMIIGDYYMHHAFADLSPANRDADGALEKFKKARESFAAASARYPLCPGLKLSEGDAALMSGDAAGAGEAYAKAFEIDQRIDDSTTRLSAIFTDPRPGAFPRHGSDGEKYIAMQLAAAGQAGQLSPAQSFGIRVRMLTALTWFLHQNQLTPSLKSADLKGFRSELMRVAEQLAATAPDAPGKAHAALLRALATRMLADEDRAALSEKLWNEAIALEKDSLEKGQPGTPQKTFETIATLYRH